jgi:arginine utilization regulatory protein
MGTNVKTLSKEVTHLFRSYHWPGNIRELEHLLEGALNIIGFDEELSLKYFSAAIDTMDNDPGRATAHPPTNPAPVHSTTKLQQNDDNLPISQRNLPESQSRFEHRTLHEALSATNGNVSQASSVLGISRQLLHYKMKKHGIRREHFFLQSR